MKMEVCGGLGGSIWHLGHLGAKMAPKIAKRSPKRRQDSQHGAKMGQHGSKMGSQICSKIMKIRLKKCCFFVVAFLIEFWRDLGATIVEKSNQKSKKT